MEAGEQAIESLHEVVLASSERCFFTPDLDSLSIKKIRVHDGGRSDVDSQLAVFLKQAQIYPDTTFTWFINWSKPKAKHMGFNSIVYDTGRHLGDIKLPPNLQIVVVMDVDSAAIMGDDFYSCFEARSDASMMATASTIRPPHEETTPISPQDGFLATPDEWKKVLLGDYHIDGTHIKWRPGALLTASTSLRIHNAPWDNLAFRWFIAEVIKTRGVYANGEWYALPDELQLEFVQPEYHYSDIQKPSAVAANSLKDLILNSRTYTYFFPHYRASATGGIEACLGFLTANQSFRLFVTETLTEAQWYKLWQQAADNQCTFELHCTPNITVPEALMPWIVQPPTMLKPKAPVFLVVAADLDDAQSHYLDALCIPISPTTSFETLFCHVHRHEQSFMSDETELLKAIRKSQPIVFKGQFSEALALRLQTLFTSNPSLYVNGEHIIITDQLVLLTDDETSFTGIEAETITYDAETDWQQLDKSMQAPLRALYHSLTITPCHSHFIDLPYNKENQQAWVDSLSQRLCLSAGQFTHPTEATTPQDVLETLERWPFVFLLSESGEGKSHFVQQVLPFYGKTVGRNITVYHGMDGLKAWAQGDGEAVLFLDEVNLSAEHFNLLDNLAHGERVIWIDGQRYPISSLKNIVCAGNPKQYEGRFEADLFRRFPYYLEFKGQPIEMILSPLLHCFETHEEVLLNIIKPYYQQAVDAGLNITPRNAQMMCLTAFALKKLPQTAFLPDDVLMRYAVLNQMKSVNAAYALTNSLQRALEQESQWNSYKQAISDALSKAMPSTDFIWTTSRQKIAMVVQLFLAIREMKIKNEHIGQDVGINALVLEGEAGLGKMQLLKALLEAQGIPYIVIETSNPETMRRQLLEAFHQGRIALINKPNSFPDEQLLNALLSGVDLEGNRPQNPGFCLLGAQKPITYSGTKAPSKAYANRVVNIWLNEYAPSELDYILGQKFNLPIDTAKKLTTQYIASSLYAQQQRIFPMPNPRAFFKQAEQVKRKRDHTEVPLIEESDFEPKRKL